MHLTVEELRVLACLIEKSFTTPDQYPLTTNALTTACNQKTSREPVVDYPSHRVDEVMQLLRDAGWARSVRRSGSRAFKHKHVIDEHLEIDEAEQAVVAVLALRGPQSVGELSTRTERYGAVTPESTVEHVLTAVASRPEPLVRNVGRCPGQSQDRWVQLIGVDESDESEAGTPELPREPAGINRPSAAPTTSVPAVEARPSSIEAMQDRLAKLEARVDELERLLE